MKETFGSVSSSLGLRQSTIRHFCNDFNIPLKEQFLGKGFVSSSVLKNNFIEYLKNNVNFLRNYQEDYYSDKTPIIVAKTIKRDINEVETYLKKERPESFKDGVFIKNRRYPLRYLSSYKIDFKLGGNYDHLKLNPKRTNKTTENKKITSSSDLNIVGYEDILISILEQIEPILNPSDKEDWGLNNPGGILLFGPPGCGKTFWAEKIATIIEYKFEEIPRSIFGSSLVDGAMINLREKLNEFSNKSKVILFFDEFDSVASIRSNRSSGAIENAKVVNTLLQTIPKLIERQILIAAATNFLDYLDPAVIRPGRFDLKIPVFPPNTDEKAELIVSKLVEGLQKNSPLLQILMYNNATESSYWKGIASEMLLFSTSLVIDYTQLLKRRLKLIYSENPTIEIVIDDAMLKAALNETNAKLTNRDAEIIAQFYNEVKKMGSNFYKERLDFLYQDLDRYFSRFKKADKPKPIGFRQPNVE